jgi:hypothetical protein
MFRKALFFLARAREASTRGTDECSSVNSVPRVHAYVLYFEKLVARIPLSRTNGGACKRARRAETRGTESRGQGRVPRKVITRLGAFACCVAASTLPLRVATGAAMR